MGGVLSGTVITTWGIMALLMGSLYFLGRDFERAPVDRPPGPLQNAVELAIEGVAWLVEGTMGKERMGFLPYIGTLSFYLLVANLVGLVGITPPTSDLNTTLALASITFVNIQYYGLRRKGLKNYLKGFIEPIPLLLPLNIISEIALPFSMAFRLFGNMLGGVIIMGLLYRFAPILVPVLPHLYFDIFAGIIQTFIFVMLTMTFISVALD